MHIIKETLRYLGYRGQQPDERTMEMVEEVLRELKEKSRPKSIYREYGCSVDDDIVLLAGLNIHSANLAKNLEGCACAVILAATLGNAADLMIKKYTVSNLAKAAVVQAAGAAYMEAYIDELEDTIRKEAELRGLYLRPRFSPGYGDFALECQKDIFAVLECNKRIGIALTEGNLMMPSKSVTAIIGLTSKEREACSKTKDCNQCNKSDCEFRQSS